MVERFNGRLEQVLRSHHFNSAQDLATTLHRYVWLYNEHLPQKALQHLTPLAAMKRWRSSHPHLFSKQVRNHPGPDTYDNALAETIIGLYKTEVIHRRGPWRHMDAVEYATPQWVDWFNHRRRLEPIGNVPPAELEASYHQSTGQLPMAA